MLVISVRHPIKRKAAFPLLLLRMAMQVLAVHCLSFPANVCQGALVLENRTLDLYTRMELMSVALLPKLIYLRLKWVTPPIATALKFSSYIFIRLQENL